MVAPATVKAAALCPHVFNPFYTEVQKLHDVGCDPITPRALFELRFPRNAQPEWKCTCCLTYQEYKEKHDQTRLELAAKQFRYYIYSPEQVHVKYCKSESCIDNGVRYDAPETSPHISLHKEEMQLACHCQPSRMQNCLRCVCIQ